MEDRRGRRMRILINCWLHFWGTSIHKAWVIFEIAKVAARLLWRGLMHDWSKFSPAESRGFIRVIHRLRKSTYGSEEYRQNLREIGPCVDLHFSRNRHHPKFHENGIGGMSMYDIIEMLCDWKAAIRRHADGNIERSFEENRKRFGISPELERLMRSL